MVLLLKNNTIFLVIITLLLLIISGCVSKESSNDEAKQIQMNTLNGDSDHWNLQGYNIKIEGNTLFVGGGELQYKLDEEVKDNLAFTMVAQVDENEIVLQEMKIVSSINDFNNQDTGKAEIEVPMNKGEEMKLTDVDIYYAVVEWKSSQGENLKEYISIY